MTLGALIYCVLLPHCRTSKFERNFPKHGITRAWSSASPGYYIGSSPYEAVSHSQLLKVSVCLTNPKILRYFNTPAKGGSRTGLNEVWEETQASPEWCACREQSADCWESESKTPPQGDAVDGVAK